MLSPLDTLSEAGVSIWLDDLSRKRLRSGSLGDLVRDRSLRGVTTNPTIFQKAISSADAYKSQLEDLATRGVSTEEALRLLTTYDVRWACDVLRPVYDASNSVDGRVSIEVDPRLSRDAAKTIAEARSLWWLVDRPNLYIKIPATLEGLEAISQALAEGISVNVTLIFSLQRYADVIESFFSGLERARNAGHDLSTLGSVASFFVSRVDTEVDARLDKLKSPSARALKGKAALANTQLAYQLYEEYFASPRWEALKAAGALPQRPLWASTGVKDPSYPDTLYVTELVAPGTVNTMPEPTLQAVYDHGVFSTRIPSHYQEATRTMQDLADLGISYQSVVQTLEEEGLSKFEDSWAELTATVQATLHAPSDS